MIVQNNTTHPLVLKTTSTLGSQYWKNKSTYIPPGGRAEIYETNRDKGVKDGKTYHFTTEVSVKNPKTGAVINQFEQNFALRLKLRGSTVGSHMWQSVRDQVNQQHNWHDDRKKWNAKMRIGKRQWDVKYWAYFTGGDDDVEFVFQEEYPLPVGNLQKLPHEWRRSHLNVLSYNIYMRPRSLFKNGQWIRAQKIPDKIPGYDVIVFQEAFDDGVRSELLKRLKKKYPHQSRILGSDSGVEQDGGVIMVSKWPIVSQKQKLFGNVCSSDDCLADKGVLYVKINKEIKKGEKNYFHIFGTHLNNGNWGIQKKQLKIIRNFIGAQKIPKSEPVLIAGDMNIRKSNTNQFNAMLGILGASYFSGNQLKGHPFSSDGPLNDLGDGSPSYLDYVLYSTRHSQITKASFAEVRILRSYDEWKEFAHEKAMWDLSDHFPVYANYHFHYDPLADWDPGLVTAELTRYWKGQWNDVAAVATKQALNAMKKQGYQRVGAHGLLFKTMEDADRWSKSAPPSPKRAVRQSSNSRRSSKRVRSRGIPEGNVGSGEVVQDMIADSELSEEGVDVVELEEDAIEAAEEAYAEPEEEMEGMSPAGDERTDLAMEQDLEETGEVVERGISRRARKAPPRTLSRIPSQQSSGKRVVKSQAKGSNLTVLPIVPLNLYYSARYKDHFSTTSVARGKQAMQGAGKYQHVGVQGYVFSNTMYRKLPNSLRSRMISMYSYYHAKTRDNLIATSPGDNQDAQKRGYKRIALEGYLIKPGTFSSKSCKVKSDCLSGFFCDTKQGVCKPNIR